MDNRTDRMQAIARWIQREDEELLYTPDPPPQGAPPLLDTHATRDLDTIMRLLMQGISFSPLQRVRLGRERPEEQAVYLGNGMYRTDIPAEAMQGATFYVEPLLDRLFSGEPLLRSAELQALAEEVTQHSEQQRAVDVDIEQWARRLADDVSQATD